MTESVAKALRGPPDEAESAPGSGRPEDAGEVLQRLDALRMEDLLGRPSVRLTSHALALDLEGRPVLITGAAGSIGSELAFQVALHRPENLILFDHDETGLFYLELDLRERFPDLRLTPVVGDITDEISVDRVFGRFAPQRVYHAAAYKHVPMMETHAREAIRNNVIGTHTVAATAGARGAQRFVLMSTDKAVQPCSVMGATKRLAELTVLALQTIHPHTTYCGVRFGNVLGSSGSVLPIFARQLRADRPLTVTHPEATRYFMTTSEAVQLILHAALLPDIRGHLAMLEMGDQMPIVELAQALLKLVGREGGNGRGIVFTGLRPGERLHERLTAYDEETRGTVIPKVQLVVTPRSDGGAINRLIPRWKRLLESGEEDEILRYMGRQFPELSLDPRVAPDTDEKTGHVSRDRPDVPSVEPVFGPSLLVRAAGRSNGQRPVGRWAAGTGRRFDTNGAGGGATLVPDADPTG